MRVWKSLFFPVLAVALIAAARAREAHADKSILYAVYSDHRRPQTRWPVTKIRPYPRAISSALPIASAAERSGSRSGRDTGAGGYFASKRAS